MNNIQSASQIREMPDKMKTAYIGTKLPINLEVDLAILLGEQIDIAIIPPANTVTADYIREFGDYDCIVTGNTITALRLCSNFVIGTYSNQQLHLFDLRFKGL